MLCIAKKNCETSQLEPDLGTVMSITHMRLLPAPESAHGKSQRLWAEARVAADDHVALLQRALTIVADLAGDVGQGGEVYPPGVRELAAKIAGDAAWCAATMHSIMRSVGRTPNTPSSGDQ